MTEAFEILFTASFWVAAIRIASPLIFATMGELICERAGVLNLGIEGIMVAGAFSGWFTVYMGGDLWTGVFVAAMTGAMFGLLHGFLTVPLGLSQHVTGIGITLLASSLTYFTYRILLPEVTSPPKHRAVSSPFAVPVLSGQFPVLDRAVQQTAAHYLRLMLTVAGVVHSHASPHLPVGRCGARRGRKPARVEGQGISSDGGQMAR